MQNQSDDDARTVGVTGTHTQDGVPHGVTSLSPYVAVPDVVAAARFCEAVFGARIVTVTTVGDTAIHSQVDFGQGQLHFEMPNPDGGGLTAAAGPDHVAFSYYCADVDAVVDRARAAGAEVLTPAINFASGDRFIAVRDPSGLRWSITTRVEDLSEEESARRVNDWMASNRSV